ncbi:SNF2 family DNA helicase domain protein [Candidatus Erwinia dacicola]|uniref:SNF2 family DNA helicase domain protein n=1 Tax=Candidatus Erwinia dacicola TaxID=252393 RepID=A0A328TS66_9GAMM|nr:SNF2 family DNA helicase domain protein [Candidatus Erwinia dacicola]
MVVVSYGLLLQDASAFGDRQWHSVVLDEARPSRTHRPSGREP